MEIAAVSHYNFGALPDGGLRIRIGWVNAKERCMSGLKSAAKAALGPKRWGQVSKVLRKCQNYGLSRYCPCCQSTVRAFKHFGVVRRPDAECPVCGALERHRLIYLYMTKKTDLFDAPRKKMLHVAPEPQLSRLLQNSEQVDYLSADLFNPNVMVKMDITDIQYPDETFDVIYCSHVLEHVPDDRKAMREFFRVLKTGGWAILLVPITAETTFEDPSVSSPEERERLFGQHDHVRRYGPDYVDRLREAGFTVAVDEYVRDLDEETRRRYSLISEPVYFCRKEA